MKTRVTASAIIYNADAPEELFVEIKDDGHPIPIYRNRVVLVGGHREESDRGPRETFNREVVEELKLAEDNRGHQTLANIVNVIQHAATPFETFLYTVEPGDALPQGWREIMAILKAPVPAAEWEMLTKLQKQYGNLSTESFTATISLGDLLKGAVIPCSEVAFALRAFYTSLGLTDGENIPVMQGAAVKEIGLGNESWEELIALDA